MTQYVYSSDIHERLYAVRKALRLSQKEMARRMGFSESVCSKSENRMRDPIKEYYIIAVCNTFNVNIDFLVYGEGPMFDEMSAKKKEFIRMYSELTQPYQDQVLDYMGYLLSKAKTSEGSSS